MSNEVEYRRVPGIPVYLVGSDGSVWKARKPHTRPSGYHFIGLYHDGQETAFAVHRLVLSAFRGPCPEGMEAAHNNGDRGDNRLENLRWATHTENMADQLIHGTHPSGRRGEQNTQAKLTNANVQEIYRRRAAGEKLKAIAADYGVSISLVSRVAKGERWKHVA